MKILLFSSTNYPHVGGQSTHMEKLGDAFVRLGHEVEYLSPSDTPPLTMLALRKSASLLRRLFGPWLWVIYYLYGLTFLLSWLAMNRIRKHGFEIVHTQDPIAFASTPFGRKAVSHKVFLTIHGYFAYESVAGRARKDSFMWSFLRKMELRAYHGANLIFAVDEGIRSYVESFGVDLDKIVVLRNFVDTDEFSPAESKEPFRREFSINSEKFVVLCPRRLVRKCGVIYAAYAAKKLRDFLGTDFLLLFAGEGSEGERIAQYANENGLQENIVLMGNVPHERMSSLIRAANAVVIPSVTIGIEREATSISALEAMASGVPVVASDIGGLSELIRNEETGYLVPERDDFAIAKVLYKIATENQTVLTKEARKEVVSKYSHIERAKEVLRFYEGAS
ncbi:MAG: glycosyltransferase family 4 protein [Thermoplasmata archaeon]